VRTPEEIKEMLESAKTYLLEIQNRSEERLAEVKSFAQQMRDALAQLVKEGEEFLDLGAGI
jgi:predicted transcriptional regulator